MLVVEQPPIHRALITMETGEVVFLKPRKLVDIMEIQVLIIPPPFQPEAVSLSIMERVVLEALAVHLVVVAVSVEAAVVLAVAIQGVAVEDAEDINFLSLPFS
jgi:hypothetical protein